MVPADDLTDAGMIGGDHAPYVFRVQPRRKGSRADQFAKHDCQVASLGLIQGRGFGRCFGRSKIGAIKLRDGTKYLAAMPKRNAEFL